MTTTLTEAGYVGDDVETVLQRLIQAADGDVVLHSSLGPYAMITVIRLLLA